MSFAFEKPSEPFAINKDHHLFQPQYYLQAMGIATPRGLFDPVNKKFYNHTGSGEFVNGGWQNLAENEISWNFGTTTDPDTLGNGNAVVCVGRFENTVTTFNEWLSIGIDASVIPGGSGAGIAARGATNVRVGRPGGGGGATDFNGVGYPTGDFVLVYSQPDSLTRYKIRAENGWYLNEDIVHAITDHYALDWVTLGEGAAGRNDVIRLDFFASFAAPFTDAQMESLLHDPYQLLDGGKPILAGNTQRRYFGGAVVRNGFID